MTLLPGCSERQPAWTCARLQLKVASTLKIIDWCARAPRTRTEMHAQIGSRCLPGLPSIPFTPDMATALLSTLHADCRGTSGLHQSESRNKESIRTKKRKRTELEKCGNADRDCIHHTLNHGRKAKGTKLLRQGHRKSLSAAHGTEGCTGAPLGLYCRHGPESGPWNRKGTSDRLLPIFLQ